MLRLTTAADATRSVPQVTKDDWPLRLTIAGDVAIDVDNLALLDVPATMVTPRKGINPKAARPPPATMLRLTTAGDAESDSHG